MSNLYTPVLKGAGRLRIVNPRFSEGFTTHRIANKLYGTVTDDEAGKTYKIFGKTCGLKCVCDAWAVEVN